MRLLLIALLLGWMFVAGCNTAKDAANTAESGGENAVGVAEQMSDGTLGGSDIDEE